MPHALAMPSSGFQALILCGPGVSLNTFTSTPDEFPKALVPIANRPMIWYPLDLCYRMGITNIHLITPPSSSKAIEAALSQNPHLTSLPLPKADILMPEGLSQNTGTAEILRLPEVRAAITGDFLILPCDLVCEVAGESLLEAWMIQQAGLGGTAASSVDHVGPNMGFGGEKGRRRGGLGVWFPTRCEDSVKGEETDFVITTALPQSTVPSPEGSLRSHVSEVVYATTTDTLRDVTEEKKTFPIRHGLIRKHGKIKILTTHRDAHVYLFPYWVLDLVKRNEKFDSISEDVVGWWAKAGWQDGLAKKLGFLDILDKITDENVEGESRSRDSGNVEDDLDLAHLSTTHISSLRGPVPSSSSNTLGYTSQNSQPRLPRMLAYVHPSTASPTSLIRRVDTPALLLSTSLYIATLPPSSESEASNHSMPTTPFSHPVKIGTPELIAPQTTVTALSCLIGPNTSVDTHAVIKTSVIGANCHIESGARLTKCLLMDEVIVGEKTQLTGCIIGKRARVEKGCILGECEVQGRYVVSEGTESKGEKFMVSGLYDLDEGSGGEGSDGAENEAGRGTLEA